MEIKWCVDGIPYRDDRIITINGRNIKDIKDEIRIKEGDVIAVFPPVAGG